MSKISDELRDWCDRNDENGCGCFVTEYSFEDICDLADRIDSEMVELPKDADGEYIHIGDVMEWCDDADVDGDACDKPRNLAERIRKLAKEQTNE